MTLTEILYLVLIGIVAGSLSGFIGIGGGVVIVPALVFFLGLTQHQAQGTSLLLMLPPIGILAVMNYHKSGMLTTINYQYAGIMVVAFIIGGFLGSKLSIALPAHIVKRVFGVFMLLISLRMIFSK